MKKTMDENKDINYEKEEKKQSKVWVHYLITLGIAIVFSVIAMAMEGMFGGHLNQQEVYMLLSDAFFVSGAVIFGVGILVFVSTKGSFDGLTYSLQFVAQKMFFKRNIGGYYEYKEEKRENRKRTPFAHMLIIGLAFILLGGLFTGLFLSMEA